MNNMVFFSGFVLVLMAGLLWFLILLCGPITRWATSKGRRLNNLCVGMIVVSTIGGIVAWWGILMGVPR